MPIVHDVVADLEAQSAELDALVSDLDDAGWRAVTPAPGWTVAHQIAHLEWTDRAALLAVTDPDAFGEALAAAVADPSGFVDEAADQGAAREPAEVLATWRQARADLAAALLGVPDGTAIAWFGPPMSAASMATARLMETWAHGTDVADALGVTLTATDRLKGVVHIGVRTRDFAYLVNGRTPPAEPFRFEITAPSGEVWTWGPEDAADVVRASAVDFCLLVTQRAALADLDVALTGDHSREWATIAQCFAGPPGVGREPASAATPASATQGSETHGSASTAPTKGDIDG